MKRKVLTCNEPTDRTGRTYPKDEVEKAVDEYQATIDAGVAYGELNNPNVANVSVAHVSHRVLDMHFEDDDLYASIEILDTPAGKRLMELIEVGDNAVRMTPIMMARIMDDGTVKDIKIEKTNFIANTSEEN